MGMTFKEMMAVTWPVTGAVVSFPRAMMCPV